MGYHVFAKKVKELWKPQREIDIMILGFGYYLVRFTLDEDMKRVMLDGPWVV